MSESIWVLLVTLVLVSNAYWSYVRWRHSRSQWQQMLEWMKQQERINREIAEWIRAVEQEELKTYRPLPDLEHKKE